MNIALNPCAYGNDGAVAVHGDRVAKEIVTLSNQGIPTLLSRRTNTTIDRCLAPEAVMAGITFNNGESVARHINRAPVCHAGGQVFLDNPVVVAGKKIHA